MILLNRISSGAILTALLAAHVVVAQATNGPTEAAANPARDHWNRVVTLNSLTAEGNTPFYLKIEFQIFDLKGKPGETGTAEVWWSKQRRYEVIASPSWNETSAPGEHDQPQTRQSYLIRALIEQVMHPMQGARMSPASKIVEADRRLRKHQPALPIDRSRDPGSRYYAGYCVEPANDELRVSFHEGSVVLRNKMGKFRDTDVALDLTTSYGANNAITGKVVALKAISADEEHVNLCLNRPQQLRQLRQIRYTTRRVLLPCPEGKIGGNPPP